MEIDTCRANNLSMLNLFKKIKLCHELMKEIHFLVWAELPQVRTSMIFGRFNFNQIWIFRVKFWKCPVAKNLKYNIKQAQC